MNSSSDMNFIGQEKILDFFERAIASEKLAQAYCFVGPDGIGRKTLATELCARLLVCESEKVVSHPDFVLMSRETDEKTGKLKKDLSVKQARELRARMHNRSWLNGYQAVIIDGAECLNEEAANALLKILEEPPAKSIFFLLTTNDRAIPATILSRCQMLYFSAVPDRQIADALMKAGCAPEKALRLAGWAWGRPGKAIELMNDEELENNYEKETRRWKEMIGRPFYAKLKLVDEIFGDKSDHIKERGKLQKILEIWTMLWRDALLARGRGESDPKYLKDFSGSQLVDIIGSLESAKRMLSQNVHPRLLIEQLLLKF